MTGNYFDDIEIGQRFVTMGRTVTEPDLVNWVTVTGMQEELFVNREYARKHSVFGRPIVPAPLTQALATGLFNHMGVLRGTNVALLGYQLRALAPLFLGDTIHDEVEVSSKKQSSRPDRGVVTFVHTVSNQEDRPVLSFSVTMMVLRRPDLVEAEE